MADTSRNRACFVGKRVLRNKTCKISGACSIKSFGQGNSLYKRLDSAANIVIHAVFERNHPASVGFFAIETAGEYCTAMVQRHAYALVVLILGWLYSKCLEGIPLP
ncbi:hypothetical protein [Pseudomonas sp. TWP3-1]|uniref:hypothetical protein n=1 Tax=Pseudomonas sp. TWP3-1 TaxID=2804631 RepID=UPI003CF257E9